MTINADPIAIGARFPAPGSMTHIPMVRTRKNVPMNSVRYFFIGQNVRFAASLVRQITNTTTFAARDFCLRRGASDPSTAVALLRKVDAHTLPRSVAADVMRLKMNRLGNREIREPRESVGLKPTDLPGFAQVR